MMGFGATIASAVRIAEKPLFSADLISINTSFAPLPDYSSS